MRRLICGIVLALLSERVLGCSTCGAALDDTLPLLQGTALLSLAPLVFIGSVIFFVYRRTRRHKDGESSEDVG